MIAVGYRYSLLGPVRVWLGDREVDPGSPQQCAVLALLLLAQGHPVTIDRLVEQLWGYATPATAMSTARTYISRLRGLLPGDGVYCGIQSGPGGYRLRVEPDALDLTRFQDLVRSSRATGKSGSPGTAAEQLREALSLWQGTALAGARAEFVTDERARLEQLRLDAHGERIALDLALGRHNEVLPEVSSLAAASPLDERLSELHMLSLYRSARQADALQVYRTTSELLHRQLGIQPGPELRALHQQILRADPDLGLSTPAALFSRQPTGADDPIRAVEPALEPVSVAPAPDTTLDPDLRPALLGDRLRAAHRRCFVGRAAERALFATAIDGSRASFVTLFLHGPGGVGKSTLLHRLADDAAAAGRTVIRVDGRMVEGSVAAFTEAAAPALGDPDAVLLIDTFERCAQLERWLREEYLPKLADGAVVVVAGRHPPSPAWRADPSWSGVLLTRTLGDLSATEATALLNARGVPARPQRSVLARVGGYPLALSLAAETARHRDSATSSWSANQDIIETLLDQLIGAVPSAAHRLALHVCAHAYVTTEELLRVVMPTDDTAELFSWLRAQPFIGSGPNGLYPHDIVRDVLDADLRWRDPAAYESIHRQIRHHVLDALVIRNVGGPATLSTMRSVRHLLRHSGTPTWFLTAHGESEAEEDQLRQGDRPQLLAMTASTEGAESARIVEFWLDRQPSAFSVYRHRVTGSPVAFMARLKLRTPRNEAIEIDPVVAAAWEHSQRHSAVQTGEHIRLARHLIYPACYLRPSPIADMQQARIVSDYLSDRDLAWSYVVVTNPQLWQPWMSYLNLSGVPASPAIGGRSFALFAHDWRLEPPEAWRDRQVAHELWGSELAPLTSLSQPVGSAPR